jgi:hypothetical protein
LTSGDRHQRRQGLIAVALHYVLGSGVTFVDTVRFDQSVAVVRSGRPVWASRQVGMTRLRIATAQTRRREDIGGGWPHPLIGHWSAPQWTRSLGSPTTKEKPCSFK